MEDERNEGFATLEFFPPMDGKKTVCAFSSWGLTCCSFHSTRLCKYIIPDSLSAYFVVFRISQNIIYVLSICAYGFSSEFASSIFKCIHFTNCHSLASYVGKSGNLGI